MPIQAALGHVLAENINSLVDVPQLDNTSMDGHAVRCVDNTATPGKTLRIAQRIPAGSMGAELEPGTAAKIFTGALVPPGADAVVMQEDCTLKSQTDQVTINIAPSLGQWIRRRGKDLTAGRTALATGIFLRPQELGVAASAGLTHLNVKRRVKVAAFFTGDRLALPGSH